ncbi:response regulator transcription factor [Flavobacterium johnsoniae]|uniref:Two component transcriptional regulator, LuxR family n=1 Tax=Flavobacterium johnsoniae (strain ATCC 17061 / DSM 2064 / JCM 8514 / BCRC 14874 / CCUG 350202 / NBRC 14942 / NCIMB 11054 / UW101) TaxID=376686 RepID=A5FIE9_FLAJ1|nr:response regulator transcription factor [Flavobacterium johnsoniae]ABQ05019.1 two component transcriptional regulator, LuxR family [Flavobacterium johnsoniae UW101]OXG00403.1 DNA-binding response regulator [Flavobacterium johnsoniae UW101]WQG83183.1 response regulator transcription factor [Flavobacterium johnsoniae UW101]SHL89175.1 two component transcriptional regulator, LuxR family [Flavobacterium johnsoniae]
MNQINLLIADDHTMFLQGIISLLEQEPNITIIDKAVNGIEALEIIKKGVVDFIILDISMPEMDGIELSKILKKQHPNVKILIVSTHSNVMIVSRLIRIGVNGYLLKNAAKEELLKAINTIASGENYFAEELEEKHLSNSSKIEKQVSNLTELSSREKEILVLIAHEYNTAEIAEKTFISLNTVNTHRRNLLSKLNAKNTAGLVKYAVENGLVD